jgi:hypothetical protein
MNDNYNAQTNPPSVNHFKYSTNLNLHLNFIFMGPCIVRYRGGIYDQQDATNSQYFIARNALSL